MKDKSKKKNILFIATLQSYFVDNQASFYRMYNNLLFFHNHQDFNVIVLQPDFDKEKEKESYKRNIKTFYFKQIKIFSITLTLFTDFNPFFILKILNIIKKYQIHLIHVEFPYGINCLRFITRIPVSYNAHNVEYLYNKQVGKYHSKIPKFLRFIFVSYIHFIEKYAIKHVKNVNAISKSDKEKFSEIYKVPEEKVTISNLGYKKAIFNNPLSKDEARERFNIDKNTFIVIFHGSYFQSNANREAINIIKDKIAPKIKDDEILFLLAGERPPFRNRKNLRYLGYVDDLKDFLYTADVAIVPIIRGSGVRTKIIDYLSANIPIISTKKGVEGLLFIDGMHGFIVEDAIEDFVEKILLLKNNPDKTKELKKNIKNLIQNNYNWEKILNKLGLKYKKIIKLFHNS